MAIHFIDVADSSDVKLIVDRDNDLTVIRCTLAEAKTAWAQLGRLLDEKALAK